MIKDKKELDRYIQLDMMVYNRKSKYPRFFFDYIWKFQYSLRHEEYYINRKQTIYIKLKGFLWGYLRRSYGYKLGFSINPNNFGPGLRINHIGLIVINPNVRIGAFCNIHQGVNIGQNGADDTIPIIGNNCFIAPGVKIYGKIRLADGISIGSNSVVNKSFMESNIVIAGMPAVVIKRGVHYWNKDISLLGI